MRNLGPVMERLLAEVGITTPADLRAVGAVEAFARLRFVHPRTSLNALHAMEAALLGIPWQDLPHERKAALLAALPPVRPAPGLTTRLRRPRRSSP